MFTCFSWFHVYTVSWFHGFIPCPLTNSAFDSYHYYRIIIIWRESWLFDILYHTHRCSARWLMWSTNSLEKYSLQVNSPKLGAIFPIFFVENVVAWSASAAVIVSTIAERTIHISCLVNQILTIFLVISFAYSIKFLPIYFLFCRFPLFLILHTFNAHIQFFNVFV